MFEVFNMNIWQKTLNHTINEYSDKLHKYPSPNGEDLLREEIINFTSK